MNDETILNMYLKEINRIPLLTREEETELAKKAAAGDRDAKEKIVRANLRFVVNVAKNYHFCLASIILTDFDKISCHAGEAHVARTEGGLQPTASKERRHLVQQPSRY